MIITLKEQLIYKENLNLCLPTISQEIKRSLANLNCLVISKAIGDKLIPQKNLNAYTCINYFI